MSIRDHLIHLYGEAAGAAALTHVESLLVDFRKRTASPSVVGPISQRDLLLITYPDQVLEDGRNPLQVLYEFLEPRIAGLVTAVHLLPFFPSSSDDGFSVVDYRSVDPAFGDWEDVSRFSETYRLMVDAVLNHTSAGSAWFQGFCRGEEPWQDFYIAPDPQADWSNVIRPRATPLFTAFDTARGPASVWTTFSADQVDLNYANPRVLLEMVEVLLGYLRRGAQWIRLDAVGYLWKAAGSTCLHLPQTHRVVRLLRAILDQAAPWARLITETNVPHVDNVAYFGAGDEAHMVYQFSLAPLIVHTLLSGDATALTTWAQSWTVPPPGACYLNFIASHDGIGLTPTRGILDDAALDRLMEKARACGGVSYRTTQAGTLQPYELNVNLLDLLSADGSDVRRFLLAHAILLSFAGVPALYFHSLFGTRGDPQAVQRTGHLRSINRQKLDRIELESELATAGSIRARIFEGLGGLIRARQSLEALDPSATQECLDLGPQVFGMRRTAASGRWLVCLAEVAGLPAQISLDVSSGGVDRLSGERVSLDAVNLVPHQARWIDVTAGSA